MKIQSTRWNIHETLPEEVSQELSDYSPIFRQILYNRNIRTQTEAVKFLHAQLPEKAGSPLRGIPEAVARIRQAIEHGEQIAVYGDYDADGVTGTALLVQTLRACQANVRPYIPDRFSEGYGLKEVALDKLKVQGVDLVITVDCGIRAVFPAKYAAEIGLDLIITDHHSIGADIPQATALINPKQDGTPEEERFLAGVGVAFKLAQALIDTLQPQDLRDTDLLDLVAIGTVADMVPLVGENRALVREGLRYIHQPVRQGLASLCAMAEIPVDKVGVNEIGFGIGPRLNAAGRIGSAMDAYNLLITEDIFQAGSLAQTLDNRNRERQRITQEIQEKVEEASKPSDPDQYLLFAYDPNFNSGVVGLAAARLVEQYYLPAIVGHYGEEYTRASCRSIPEFHITHALEQCADLLTYFGGHAAAAGFTVHNDNLEELEIRLTEIAAEQLADVDISPALEADAEVKLIDLKPSLLREMILLQPTGMQNPEPLFVSRRVSVKNKRAVGRDESHLKLSLSDGRITFDAIAFRFGHLKDNLPDEIDIAFAFELNEFNGRQSLQLNIKDIKFS